MIEVDGVIEFVFFSDHNDGISRDLLLHRNINTEEKKDDEKANKNYRYDLVFLFHSLSFRGFAKARQDLHTSFRFTFRIRG